MPSWGKHDFLFQLWYVHFSDTQTCVSAVLHPNVLNTTELSQCTTTDSRTGMKIMVIYSTTVKTRQVGVLASTNKKTDKNCCTAVTEFQQSQYGWRYMEKVTLKKLQPGLTSKPLTTCLQYIGVLYMAMAVKHRCKLRNVAPKYGD